MKLVMNRCKALVSVLACVVAMLPSCTGQVELVLGEPVIVVQGIRPEEKLWGPYQFPVPYQMGDRIVVSVHVSDDSFTSYADPYRWFESRDGGKHWQEVSAAVADSCGTVLPDGDVVRLPMENSKVLTGWKFESFDRLTPDYDFSCPAEEGCFPIPDGARGDLFGSIAYTYKAERLAPSLRDVKWAVSRFSCGEVIKDTASVDWPGLSRVVHCNGGFNHPVLKSVFPRGYPRVGPDGRLWVTAFSGEGHISRKTGVYSPYYSALLFVSDDGARSFRMVAEMEYPADGTREYPYASGGFSDSDIAFFPDGSMVWFFRSNWYGTTGQEWSPMYWSRSEDEGKSWSKPVVFSFCGTLPRVATLECGTSIVVYGRPGIFVQASLDRGGKHWSEPLEVMTASDRSSLANIPIENPTFHEYDGAGGNPEIIPLDADTALLVYSDFYVPDSKGIKRKSILCRTITVRK